MQIFTLSDFVCRLKVASAYRLISIDVLFSDKIIKVLEILYSHGIINKFVIFNINEEIDIKNYKFIPFGKIRVFLKYYKNLPIFYNIEVISTPGRRVFSNLTQLSSSFYNSNSFSGFYIVSTNKGLMTVVDSYL